jgi:hypothetical protein
VGDGTDFFDVLPLYSGSVYNYSQQIYHGSEITAGGGMPGYITKLRFYYDGGSANPSAWANWTVYLGNTTKEEFTGGTDWVSSTSLTQVFTGNITAPGAGNWLEINFNNPFYYTGGNLVVAIDENSPGLDYTANWGSYYSGAPRGLLVSDDINNPDPSAPPAANWSPEWSIPRIQLFISNSYGVVEGIVTRAPNCLDPVAGAICNNRCNRFLPAFAFCRNIPGYNGNR